MSGSLEAYLIKPIGVESKMSLLVLYKSMLEILPRNGVAQSPFYDQGLRFSCIRCSVCCRHESGYVFLSEKDASLLGRSLNMGYREFTEAFCRWVPSSGGTEMLSLREKANYDCILWDTGGFKGGCSVYESRPLQCRAFPFWSSVVSSRENWKMTAALCPGMDRGVLHSPNSIEKWLALREREPIIERTKNKGVT